MLYIYSLPAWNFELMAIDSDQNLCNNPTLSAILSIKNDSMEDDVYNRIMMCAKEEDEVVVKLEEPPPVNKEDCDNNKLGYIYDDPISRFVVTATEGKIQLNSSERIEDTRRRRIWKCKINME
ncbi:hypothetical protein Trydic_g2720 [Trypoxylus dichotomus]